MWTKTLRLSTGLGLALLAAGCQLPVPATRIAFDPNTKAVCIKSPKDVHMSQVIVQSSGTNFTLNIGSYQSSNPVEVIRAAVDGQREQLNTSSAITDRVLKALGK